MARSTDPRILIIDKDAENSSKLAEFFDQYYYLTYKINKQDQFDVLEQIGKIKPDTMMIGFDPEDSSKQLLKNITSTFPEIPIIALLKSIPVEQYIELVKMGAWDYIEAPVQDWYLVKNIVLNTLNRKKRLQSTLIHQENLHFEVKNRTEGLEARTRFLEIAETKLKNEIALRRKIESELRESQELLVKALRIAQLGKWVWNLESNEIDWSSGIYKILDIPLDQKATVENWSRMIYVEDRGQVDMIINQAIKNGSHFHFECRMMTFNGEQKLIKSEGEVILNDTQQPVSVIGVIRDVTEQKEYENKLKRALKEAEAANHSKNNFLTTMSHELRTPMHGVLGMAELALLTDLNDDQKHYIDTIYNASQALLRVLNDILDISRIEANNLEIEDNEFELNSLIECIDQLFIGSAKTKGLEFVCHSPETEIEPLIGDSNRLTQVLSNLLANAIKFTDRGTIELRVEQLSSSESEVEIQFEIKDTGIGIPEEIQNFIFQPFTQEDSSSTRKYTGLGLGLAIVKNIIDLMGGSIGVESRHAQGSLFWIRLTFKKAASRDVKSDNKDQYSLNTDTKTLKNKKDIKILLVEDDPISQTVMDGIMTKLDYYLDIVPNGAAALTVIPQIEYDIIFMDCRMPIKNGFETTIEIRELEKKGVLKDYTPIIALTANAMKGDREKCLSAGMDNYITKPLRIEIIENILAQYL